MLYSRIYFSHILEFHTCTGLTTLTLPDSLTTISEYTFLECAGLTTLTLPDQLTTIGQHAFGGCSSLISLTLPHKLTNVGKFAFGNCPAITSIIFRPSVSRGVIIAWSVGNSRNRANWQLTTLKRLHNVLRLITAFALERRDVTTVDPDGSKKVFQSPPYWEFDNLLPDFTHFQLLYGYHSNPRDDIDSDSDNFQP